MPKAAKGVVQSCTMQETPSLGPCKVAQCKRRHLLSHARLHNARDAVSWAMQSCTELETPSPGLCKVAQCRFRPSMYPIRSFITNYNPYMKIVVLDAYALNPGDLSWEALEALGECAIYDRTAPGQVLERAKDADIILTNKVAITRPLMEALTRLRYIGVLATGYNVIDTVAAAERGIVVTNIPAYSTPSVVQMVFAHILAATNRVEHYTGECRAGVWSRNPDFTYWDTSLFELWGKTLGIVGLGHIGMAVARVALAFGMNVIALTSKKKEDLPEGIVPVDKETLFKQSDILTLHCPLTPATTHFVNATTLSLMKPTAMIINTGRGPLVDEAALATALNEGRIAAAGVDVLSSEPPAETNPLLAARNCTVTPHIAWATFEARQRLMDIAVGNVEGFLKGKVQNKVN